MEEAARLRKDLERYDGDIARSNSLMKEKEEQCRFLTVNVSEKEREIQRLKQLVDSLQQSMASLVGELQNAGPNDWPPDTLPPIPASLMLSHHTVGPGGDGPCCDFNPATANSAVMSNFSPKTLSSFAATPPTTTTSFSSPKSSKPDEIRISKTDKTLPLTIPKTVSDSLREFLQAAPEEADDVTLTKTVTPPDSPTESSILKSASQQPRPAARIDESSASRFSVSAYLKRYGLAVEPETSSNPRQDSAVNGSSSNASSNAPPSNSSKSKRSSGTFAQSTPASTPKKRIPYREPVDVSIPIGAFVKDNSQSFLPLSQHDESTLTGISEISTISAISGLKDDLDMTEEASLGSVSSLASKDEMEFKAGLEELDASIQRLRLSLKKSGGSKNL